jgi:hypothetical protein
MKIIAQYSSSLLLQHIQRNVGNIIDADYFLHLDDGKPIINYLSGLATK